MHKKNAKDTFEAWLVGELLLVALLGSATALFLTNPILRNTYELPEGRLVLDTAVILAATIVAILAGVRFSVEGRMLDLLLAAGFCIAGVGTLAFSVAPVLGGSNQGAPEAWAAIASRVVAATLIALAPLVPARRIVARKRALWAGIPLLLAALFAIWLPLHGFRARLNGLDSAGNGHRAFELTVATSFLALLALVAVVGFAIRYRRRGDDLDSWIALGATLTLFAELHYVLTPHVSSDFVSQGDFLRLLSYGVLLVGVWRAISFAEFGRAVAEERARVAREIHDGLAQYLFAVSTHASMLESGAPLPPPAALRRSTRHCAATSSFSPPTAHSTWMSRSIPPSCLHLTSRSRCSASFRRGSRTSASMRAPSTPRSGSARGLVAES